MAAAATSEQASVQPLPPNDRNLPSSDTETSDQGKDLEKEAEILLDRNGKQFEPLQSPTSKALAGAPTTSPRSRSRQGRPSSAASRERSIQRIASHTSGHSLAYLSNFEVDPELAGADDKDDEHKSSEEDAFTVTLERDDPHNPKNLSSVRKWIVVLIVSMSSVCVTSTSSMYTTTYGQLESELGISRLVATLGLSIFVMGLGVGPMFLSPLSEFYGRRPIYLATFTLFLIWLIPSAVSHNFAPILVSRFFQGMFGSPLLSVAGGTVGDMFDRDVLSAPMMVFTAAPFIGPVLGPLVGGFINQFADWRWTFYVLMIWSGAMLGAIVFYVPETFHPVLVRNMAIKRRKETGDNRWKAPIERLDRSVVQTVIRSCYRPFLLLFLEPMCTNLCIFSALLLGILYLFFGAFQLVFNEIYGFELWQRGLCFLGLLVGQLIGVFTDPLWNRNYRRLVRRAEEAAGDEDVVFEPEWRLPPAIAGAPCVTIGLFMFGWSLGSHWIVPIIGSGIFGFGMCLVFSGIFTYSVECWRTYAASALAANSFARSCWAAAFPLFGVQMYEKLGYHWASSLLAFLTVVMLPFPYIFYKYGKRIRKKSKFATNI